MQPLPHPDHTVRAGPGVDLPDDAAGILERVQDWRSRETIPTLPTQRRHQLRHAHPMMVRHAAEDALESTKFDRAVIRHDLMMLATLRRGRAEMSTILARHRVFQLP